ncbi:hypothetical protein P0R31_17460 [Bradyrhizobium yuanmingense]|uniref:hypothetical protein n=1 Tax=Bradyrhizobium yuanmingense TaxID=108015 RepID=UPI0023B8A664|nr:hypothetical protein [Bradyrhizobium yuanmingense]MDF0519025.1 hypothetical protein [Bradyrhizobium yuanmingense]
MTVVALLIAASFVVSGRPSMSQDQPSEQITPPKQSPSDEFTQSPPTGKSQEQQGEGVAAPDPPAGNQGPAIPRLRSSFKIRVTYSEKLSVPRGSDITVTITDAKGHKVSKSHNSTKQDGPPYLLEIPIKKITAYPLTLDAELVSRIGHRFSERTTIAESSLRGDAPIEIHLQKK